MTGLNTILTGFRQMLELRLSYDAAKKVDALLLFFDMVPDIPEASEASAALYSAIQAQAGDMRATLGGNGREVERYRRQCDQALTRFHTAFRDLAAYFPEMQDAPELLQ